MTQSHSPLLIVSPKIMTKDESKLSVNITQVLPPAPQQDFVVGVETETETEEGEEQESGEQESGEQESGEHGSEQESEQEPVEWNP